MKRIIEAAWAAHRKMGMRPAALAVVATFAASMAHAQSGFTPLGDLTGGAFSSQALGVSGDGSVVVGFGDGASGTEAFRWTQGGGMVGLGDLAGGAFFSSAYGVSSDGSVVVGYSDRGVNEAFRWTQAGGMVGLGDLPGGAFFSAAYGVSGDGAVVVGMSNGASGFEAFRWTQVGGMAGLGDLAGGAFNSKATGASGDGSVVVGFGTSAIGQEAFRWTQAGGMIGLGGLAGGTISIANGVSRDGTTVVGVANSPSGFEAFRWTQAGGMSGLGDLVGGGFDSAANAASANGAVVVGHGTGAGGQEAFRWTQAGGMQRVVDWLTAAGVSVAPGYAMTTARGVSDDGAVVVGDSSGPSGVEAFIARVSSIGSGAITLSNLQASLVAVSSVGGMAVALADTAFNGAHGRPLARRVAHGQKAFWLAGDWGADDHGARSGDLGLAEVGLGRHFGPAQVNISLGQTRAKQNLAFGGQARTGGTYLMAEALVPISGDMWTTLGAYLNRGHVELRRGYLNAGLPDVSAGQPGAETRGLRLRLDWDDARRIASTDFSPYADLSYVEARLVAYTETGGGFPARFDARKEKATELRLGVNATRPLENGMHLLGALEAAHRFEKSGARMAGQVLGLFGFDVAAPDSRQDWLRAGIGIEGRLAEGKATVVLNLTTRGEMPSAWLAANWQKSF